MATTGAPWNLSFPELDDSPDVPKWNGALAADVHAALNAVQSSVDSKATGSSVGALDARIGAVEGRAGNLEWRVGGLEAGLNSTNAAIGGKYNVRQDQAHQMIFGQVSVFGSIAAGGDVVGNRLRATGAGNSTYVPNVRMTDDGWLQKTSHNNSAAKFKQDISEYDNPRYEILEILPVTFKYKEVPARTYTVEDVRKMHVGSSDITEDDLSRMADELNSSGHGAGVPVSAEKYGMVADQVLEVFPEGVEFGESGEVETVDDRAILVALLSVVKDQNRRIEELERKLR